VNGLEFLLVLLLVAAGLVRLADLARVPYPVVLVLAGLGVGVVPGLPTIQLNPEIVFVVFLPPLLSAAAFSSSPQTLRAEATSIGFLAVPLVLTTMAVVAVVAHAVLPGLGWAPAFVLGAVLAPTDTVAAAAAFSRMGVPERVKLLVEGEAIVNDATALVAYRVAIAVAAGGAFSPAGAVRDFLLAALGGAAIGLLFGIAERQVLRRWADPALSIFFTVVVPYVSYVAAEQAGVSGVLAVVATSLYIGWFTHEVFDAGTRLSAVAFWGVLDFAANAILFVLLGLQFPTLVNELRGSISLGNLVGSALVVTVAVVLVRMAGTMVAGLGATRRERVAVGWSGMRGAVSLAAALAIPTGVQGREEILFVTVVVILVTLVGQGLTFAPLLTLLRLDGERPWSPGEAIARLEAAQNALDRLDELEDEGAPEELLRRMRELYRARFARCQAVIGGDGVPPPKHAEKRMRYSSVRLELIGVERASLIELRNAGRLEPGVLRAIQRDLDLEEARLR
jgi:Na+/H+ antiporter